jgi:Lipase (class 3)
MPTFDQRLARLLLEICRYTYAATFRSDVKDRDDALTWINEAGTPLAMELLNDETPVPTSVACVVAYPDKNVVSYMGTKTKFDAFAEALTSSQDWAQNFRAAPVPFKLTAQQLGLKQDITLGGRVHKGFLEELCAVQRKVIQALSKHGGRDRPLYVTGHSQGAAEAALATRAFLAGGYPVAAAYTFASPRPGDGAFVRSIPEELPFYRIEFGDDVVPHLAPALLSPRIRKMAQQFQRLMLLPPKVKNLLELVAEDFGFVGAGRLCYGSHETGRLRVNVSADQESSLFESRLRQLVFNAENWAEHHHLAGTTKEVGAGGKGNYTALVSKFPIEN